MTAGDPPGHHSNADANFYYTTSVGGSWVSPINSGYLAWDGTNGHQFNFVKTTSTGAAVSITSATICGKSSAVGCTSTGLSAAPNYHIVEATAWIKFKSTMSSGLRDDVAAHEFGHYLGISHSADAAATMWGSASEGQVSINTSDRLGRCQVYGHAHGYWGGC